MRNHLLIFVLLCQYLMASQWPLLFSEQGEPLYQAAESFQSLASYEDIAPIVEVYTNDVKHVLQLGHNADGTQSKQDRMSFLLALRSLQKSYNHIIGLSQRHLLDAMSNNDYKTFLHIVDNMPQTYDKQLKLKEQVVSYYQKHKKKGRSQQIEQLLREEKGVIKVYTSSVQHQANGLPKPASTQSMPRNKDSKTKEVTLLFRPGCPWCTKAFAYFNERGIKYNAYNINSSQGKRLFKRHNGTGVPLIIIDKQVIRGFSAQRISNALQN